MSNVRHASIKGREGTAAEHAPSLLIRQPVWIILFFLLILALVSFFHDFVQRIDEFHLWAAAVKYMTEYNRLPVGPDFIGGNPQYCFATSLFITFFQTLTGYSEPHMYAASFLLIWTGWLLPFASFKRKDWKKPALYVLILYFGVYSLYLYGLKSLYVDVHTAAWAGGLAGWWMNRRHKRTDPVTALCGVLTVFLMKPYAGPLMAVMLVVFICAYTVLVERKALEKRRVRRFLAIALPVVFLAGCALALALMIATLHGSSLVPAAFMERFTGHDGSVQKIVRTFGTFMSNMLGNPLSSKSDLKLSLFAVLAGSLLLLKASADIYRQKLSQLFAGGYIMFMSAGYLVVLFLAFIYMFSYEESTKLSGGSRYFSLLAMYMLTIALVHLFQPGTAAHPKKRLYILLMLAAVFIYGLNTNFVAQYTGWNRWKVTGYEDIHDSRSQAKQILTVLDDDDKVYFLNQSEDNEYPQNAALYYLENQVSNYLGEFWKLTKKGNITRLADYESPDIYDFPDVLEEGGYTYLWIYKTDKYLTATLPEVFDGADEVKDGQLYRVVYEDGKVTSLELCGDDKHFILPEKVK